MKILVTGAAGFVGDYLVDSLATRGHKVFAGVTTSGSIIGKFGVEEIMLDILNKNNIKSVLEYANPDVIVHLAAQSNVQLSWGNPSNTLETNVVGTANIIEVVSVVSQKTKIISIGSSEEYGLTAKDYDSLTETLPCNPQNPYAISKYAAGQATLQLGKKHNINTVHVRAFNHFGPGQKRGFVVSDFASQISEIELGKKEPVIKVGNLEASRDFTDVRDIVDSYCLIIENETKSGIYNVSSGVGRKISEILETLLENSKLSIEVVVDKEKFRPVEVKEFVGNNQKIRDNLNWLPKREFKESIKDTLNWWRRFNG